mmetsp:Transcript_10479/g.26561  ORF Transcript_10479/g.26561 Transcript_10479/m.26561 type:complete len:368 (-) Transcript_10479:78-1181(-)
MAAAAMAAAPAAAPASAMAEQQRTLEGLRAQIQQALEARAGGDSVEQWWFDAVGGPSNQPAHRLETSRILRGHFGKVYANHWAGDSKHLVSASQDGKLIVWNGFTTNKVQAIPLRSSWVMTCGYEQAEDQLIACGGLDNICSVYRIAGVNDTGSSAFVNRSHRELAAHEGYLSCCRFNGSSEIITASGDGTCKRWDIEEGKDVQTFDDHDGDVMSIAINKCDPHVFASGSTDRMAQVSDSRTGKCVMSFAGHESDINSVSFFPDGMAIGTGSDDSTCKLFDLRARRELGSYGGDQIVCGVTAVDFSGSGRFLFAGYDDFTAYGWDITNRTTPITLRCHENRVSCLQVSPAGNALCTGSWDTLLKILA